MRLPGIDHGLKLGIRKNAVLDEPPGEMRPVGWQRRGDGGHGGRLHEGRGMGLGVRDGDGLQPIGLVNALRKGGLRRSGSGRFVGEFLHILVRAWRGPCASLGSKQGRRLGLGQGRQGGKGRASSRWRPRRQLRLEQGKKLMERVRVAGLDKRSAGVYAVDDRKPGLDAGAMPGVNASANAGSENERYGARKIGVKRLDFGTGGIVGVVREHRKAAARRKPPQSGADMPHGGIAHGALDIG